MRKMDFDQWFETLKTVINNLLSFLNKIQVKKFIFSNEIP